MNIYLIGFMGVGKSTVAKELNKKLGYKLIDTDEEIESREGKSISEIFATEGEEYFRRLEAELIEEISKQDELLISCGGGIIKNEDNIKLMKQSGRVILLEASPEVIYDRVKDYNNRPLLEGKKSVEGIASLLTERQPLYDKACTDRVRAEGDIEYIVSDIIKVLRL